MGHLVWFPRVGAICTLCRLCFICTLVCLSTCEQGTYARVHVGKHDMHF